MRSLKSTLGRLCLCVALCVRVHATVTAQDSASPAFDVVSIRLNPSPALGRWQELPGGRFVGTAVPIREVIRVAYGFTREQEIRGPRLLDQQVNIVAQAPAKLAATATRDRDLPVMLRNMLIEELKLSVHTEARDTPVYLLELAQPDRRLGPNIKEESTPDCRAAQLAAANERDAKSGIPFEQAVTEAIEAELRGEQPPPIPATRLVCAWRMTQGVFEAHSVSITRFLEFLTPYLRRPVLDRTGLNGTYTFNFTFSPTDTFFSPSSARSSEPSIPDGRELFRDALVKQVGFRIVEGREPIEALIVDRIDPPSIQ